MGLRKEISNQWIVYRVNLKYGKELVRIGNFGHMD